MTPVPNYDAPGLRLRPCEPDPPEHPSPEHPSPERPVGGRLPYSPHVGITSAGVTRTAAIDWLRQDRAGDHYGNSRLAGIAPDGTPDFSHPDPPTDADWQARTAALCAALDRLAVSRARRRAALAVLAVAEAASLALAVGGWIGVSATAREGPAAFAAIIGTMAFIAATAGLVALLGDDGRAAHAADVLAEHRALYLEYMTARDGQGFLSWRSTAPPAFVVGHRAVHETPGTQTPGTQTPGTQTPGTQTPGTQTPGTETVDRIETYGTLDGGGPTD